MKKSIILIMLITVISKGFGFVKSIALSYYYGASNITDAYLIATMIPLIIFSLIGAGISTGYIPQYSEIKNTDGEKKANYFTNNLINHVLIASLIIAVVGIVFTEQVVKVFASGFEGETLKLAISFTRVSLLSIGVVGVIEIIKSYLNLKNRFLISSISTIPLNLITIISIVLSYHLDYRLLIYGAIIAIFIQLAFMIPFIYKEGFRYNFILKSKDNSLLKLLNTSIPLVLGVSINQINQVVDKTLASNILTGGVSILNYSTRLTDLVYGVFVISISTVMYPSITQMFTKGESLEFEKTIRQSIIGLTFIVLPITIGGIILSERIIDVVYGRGAFGHEEIILTSKVFSLYALGMLSMAYRHIYSKVFYAMQDTKTPMVNASIALVINILLNFILSRYLGLMGLALATTFSATICSLLLHYSLKRKLKVVTMSVFNMSFIKILIAGVLMGISVRLISMAIDNLFNKPVSLLLTIFLGASIYFILIYLFKLEELSSFLRTFRKNKINK